jgi:hypothetical protein
MECFFINLRRRIGQWFGQTKLPGNNQQLGSLSFTDRTNNSEFNIDRDFLVCFWVSSKSQIAFRTI